MILDALAVRYSATPATIAEQPWSRLLRWCEWAGLFSVGAGEVPAE